MQVFYYMPDFESCYLTYLCVHDYPFVTTIGIGQDEFFKTVIPPDGSYCYLVLFALNPERV